MKRVITSEEPLNFGENLNYVPYRQREQYFSPKYSICSKRSSFSFRSPNPFPKVKYQHKNNNQNTVHFMQKQVSSPSIIQHSYDEVKQNIELDQKHVIQKQQNMNENISIQFPQADDKTDNQNIVDHNYKNEETSQTNSVLEQCKIIENSNANQFDHQFEQDQQNNQQENYNYNQQAKDKYSQVFIEKQHRQQRANFISKQGTTKMKGKKSLVDRFSIKNPVRKELQVNLLTKFGSNKKLSKLSLSKNNPQTSKKSQTTTILQIPSQQKRLVVEQKHKNQQRFAQIMKTLKSNTNKISSKLPHKNDEAVNVKSSKLLMRFKKKQT